MDNAAIATDKPIKPASQQSTKAGRPRQLARDKAAVAQIKELWTSTDLSITNIAAQVDATSSNGGWLNQASNSQGRTCTAGRIRQIVIA